jgi:hypothetical protein
MSQQSRFLTREGFHMDNVQERSQSNEDEFDEEQMWNHIYEVYGNAYEALVRGAPKEGLLNQIELAYEAFQEDYPKGSNIWERGTH